MEIQSPLWTVKPKANDQPPSAISLREQTSLRDAQRNHDIHVSPDPKRLVTATGGDVLRNQKAIGGSEPNIVGVGGDQVGVGGDQRFGELDHSDARFIVIIV